MFRLIALYLYYRDLQEERARSGTPMPAADSTPAAANTHEEWIIEALAA
ncbi:MAG TPA: hypothetical protein VGC28_07575 [Sphingomonas sp.]